MFRFESDQQASFYDHDGIWDKLIPADSVYRMLREFAPILIKREDFKGIYCENNGRSSKEALKMTMACMIQQMLNETDRGMEWLTQFNIEIKYALFMSLDEKGIDHANFHNHRQRMIENELDALYLNRFTRLMYYLGILTGKEPFLTDTTHAVAPVSRVTTIELIRQGMRMLLRHVIRNFSSEWEALPSWPLAAKYVLGGVKENIEYRLEEQQKRKRLQDVVKEAESLITFFEEQKGSWQKDTVTVNRALILCRILHERIIRNTDGTIDVTHNRDMKDVILSAVDIETRFGNKGNTKWRGYKVASVEVGNSGFIAAADALKANEYDGDSLEKMVEQTPVELAENPKFIGDGHYGSAENYRKMKDNNIKLVAPLSYKVNAIELAEEGFIINTDHTVLTCCMNRTFTKYNELEYGRLFYLQTKSCKTCSRYSQCFKGKRKRYVFIHEHFEVILEAQKYNKTEEFRTDMRLRSRIEPKQNELANTYGLRRIRYIGKRKLAFAARMKSLAVNFQRLNRLLTNGGTCKDEFNDKITHLKKTA
jgi:hypothetical protein